MLQVRMISIEDQLMDSRDNLKTIPAGYLSR